ncbi:DUF1236 domain-containing protein [Aquibium carbonis]|nr:DUF1236 domain-containing protein [Aquibium carbonis]
MGKHIHRSQANSSGRNPHDTKTTEVRTACSEFKENDMRPILTKTLAIVLLAGTATFATQAGAQGDTTLKPVAGAKAGAQAGGTSASKPSVSAGGGAELTRPSSENAASQSAPGQQMRSGDVDSAAVAAPGQLHKSGEVDSAAEAAPGQLNRAASDDTAKGGNSASQYAPGQQMRSGDVDSAADAAPGQLQKSGDVDSAAEAAPGQLKDGVSGETTASIDLSAEQRSEFRQVIVETNVAPVDVDMQVSIGATVPGSVTLHPLPPRIVEIVPAYRSYQYFVLAGGQIVIVEPATMEVVYVIRS